MTSFRICLPIALLIAAISLTGCKPKQNLVPFSGKVVYHNQPLKFGGVMFQPEAGQPAHGEIQADGTFALSTFREGDGATVGKNLVRITCFPSQQPAGESRAAQGEIATGGSLIPTKYNDFNTSELVIEVPAGGTNDVVIELMD